MKPIKSIKIEKDMKVSKLVKEMGGCGFGAGKISLASDIFKEMVDDEKCKVFLGLAGAMVPAGMKSIIVDMVNEKKIDVLVTTGANLTHDLIEALGHHHYSGDENISDAELNKKGIDRIYNVFMKNEVYEDMENFFDEHWEVISKCKSIKELLEKIGSLIPEEKRKESILGLCYEKKIPIYCPALADSGIGLMIWGKKAAGKEIFVDAFEDMKEIIDIAWTSEKNGVIYLGGGTPKNFIQQSLQFSKGAIYGIQITTDTPQPGGSSGAPLKEGISWGKMNEKAKFVDVFCDITIALPLIYGSVK